MLQWKRFHSSLLSLVGVEAGSGESHIISGPLGQQASNLNIKKKRNPSVLAAAFQNAWKQGTLTAEVSSQGWIWREGGRREEGERERERERGNSGRWGNMQLAHTSVI